MYFGIIDYLQECSIESEIIGKNGQVKCLCCRTEEELSDEIEKYEGIMVWHYVKLRKYSIDRLKCCKVIVRVGVGYDSVNYKYAGSLGIPVVNIPDYGTNDVADHAFALLLSSCRKVHVYNEAIRNAPVVAWNPNIKLKISRLTSAVIGIVGLGRIGTAIALRAKSFGMKVLFYDPYKPDGYDKVLNAKRVETLEELVQQSDYLTIHAPLNEETNNMINDGILKKCKKGMNLINTARGEIVSLDAVYKNLKNGQLGSFAADVLEDEPPDPQHPLIVDFHKRRDWIDGKVIMTPHSAFYAEETIVEMRVKAAKQLLKVAKGEPLTNCINTDWLVDARSKVDTRR